MPAPTFVINPVEVDWDVQLPAAAARLDRARRDLADLEAVAGLSGLSDLRVAELVGTVRS